jgi:hypothetical protein
MGVVSGMFMSVLSAATIGVVLTIPTVYQTGILVVIPLMLFALSIYAFYR